MNPTDAITYLKLLRHEKQTELRAINPETKQRRSIHFSTEEELKKHCEELEGKFNLYLGVNERVDKGTEAKDVIAVGVIPVDVDCVNKPATDEDILLANQVAAQIVSDAVEKGYKKPPCIFSGNGYQLLFCVPKLIITGDNREGVEDRIQEFQKRLINKYSNDKVRLDNVGDLPRIMRIAGTFNLKSKTTSKFLWSDYEEDKKLIDDILALELSKSVIVGGLSEELKEKIKGDEAIQKLMDGQHNKPSRSEAELSLVCRLVSIGLNKEQVFRVMASCKLGKWQEANVKYRELTYRKSIELITKERFLSCKNPTLNDLYLVYKKWLYLEDTKRIDVVLATYLSRTLEGTPIWLIIVGNSGDGKTEQLMALKKCQDFHVEHSLTARTLVSGSPKVNDLAPELDGKVVAIPDMAQILQLPPQDKGELWGQLRDLYDGFAGKSSGLGKRAKYSGLRITLLACSTPKIDSQILVHQDLGTRELIYRTEDTDDKKTMMDFALSNEEFEKEMKREMTEVTSEFLKDKQVLRRELTEDETRTIKNIALFVSTVRASAEVDSMTNELRNLVYPEQPTRIVKQLKRLFLCLTSLEKDYPPKRAFEILWHLAKSCAFPIRINIFEHFVREFINTDITKEFTTSRIANNLRIGKKTAQRDLNVLWNMEILEKREIEEGNRWQPTDYWKLNLSNSFIQDYIRFIPDRRLKVRLT